MGKEVFGVRLELRRARSTKPSSKWSSSRLSTAMTAAREAPRRSSRSFCTFPGPRGTSSHGIGCERTCERFALILHLRSDRVRAAPKARDADRRGPIPHGDELHVGAGRTEQYPNAPSESGHTAGILSCHDGLHGPSDAPRQPQGPRMLESATRKRRRCGVDTVDRRSDPHFAGMRAQAACSRPGTLRNYRRSFRLQRLDRVDAGRPAGRHVARKCRRGEQHAERREIGRRVERTDAEQQR
jgi:hypothetical protein